MKILVDFFPILLFFFAYKAFDIYVATMVAIAATVIQVGMVWFRTRKVEPMHLITLALIVVFGGATIYFKDELFIKWKPTVVDWLFGLAFLLSQVIGGRTFVERSLGGNVQLPAPIWRRLNLAWAAFFFALGALNLFVVYSFDTETWVNFKLFGLLGLTLAFAVGQTIYLSRYIIEPDPE